MYYFSNFYILIHYNTILEMEHIPQKGDRITAVHLMVIFKENKGLAMRFMEIFHEMRKQGLKHNNTSISDNLKYLVNQGKIVKHSWYNNSR